MNEYILMGMFPFLAWLRMPPGSGRQSSWQLVQPVPSWQAWLWYPANQWPVSTVWGWRLFPHLIPLLAGRLGKPDRAASGTFCEGCDCLSKWREESETVLGSAIYQPSPGPMSSSPPVWDDAAHGAFNFTVWGLMGATECTTRVGEQLKVMSVDDMPASAFLFIVDNSVLFA